MDRFKIITELVYVPGALLIIEDTEWWKANATSVLHWAIETIGIRNIKSKNNIITKYYINAYFEDQLDLQWFTLKWM